MASAMLLIVAGVAVTALLLADPSGAQGPSGAVAPIGNAEVAWALLARPFPSTSGGNGTVAAVLSPLALNASIANPGVLVEIAAVSWDRSWPSDSMTWVDGSPDILGFVDAHLDASPSIALTRARLSAPGDSVELLIPSSLNASTIIVYAPETESVLFVEWPSGRPFRFVAGEFAWFGDEPAVMLAGTREGAS